MRLSRVITAPGQLRDLVTRVHCQVVCKQDFFGARATADKRIFFALSLWRMSPHGLPNEFVHLESSISTGQIRAAGAAYRLLSLVD